jgi:oxygen-independent coproporphyrinogen-3 oxidase
VLTPAADHGGPSATPAAADGVPRRATARAEVPDLAEIDHLLDALRPALHVPYAPPNIYPMSAPIFTKLPGATRPRIGDGPLGVYVHVPFCNYACNFCFYAKRVGDTDALHARYVAAVQKELEAITPGSRLAQLYVGGGTPTTLTPPRLDAVLAAVVGRAEPRGDDVHTVECSPESITPAHVRVLRGRGVGRVSVGVQSLDDGVLETVHRRHDRRASLAALDLLVGEGLTVNVDLIFGLPGQKEAAFCQDLEHVTSRGIHSVTTYSLRVNERTPVANLLREEERLDLRRLVRWRAVVRNAALDLGLEPTRWHTFVRPGSAGARFEDRTGTGDQLGVGMSARSRFGATIYRNHTNLQTYLARIESNASPVEEVFALGDEDLRLRFIGRTLGEGRPLARNEYVRLFGCSFDDEFVEPLERLRGAGLLADDETHVRLTEIGTLLCDLTTLAFYPRRLQDWLYDRQQAAFRQR